MKAKNKRITWNKCDQCGRFISFNDFIEGNAIRKIILPDSDYSIETFCTLCPKHRNLITIIQPNNQ
jgi:hypothetical protein